MTTPGTPESPAPSLQFDTASPAVAPDSAPQAFTCAQCKLPISEHYYELRGQTFCAGCADKIRDHVTTRRSGRFGRAALYGFGAAIAGALLYYAISAATGLEIGLIAIVVGWMVGRAVQKGAAGLGGRKYQVLAVLLTYLAIGATYVPLALRESRSDTTSHAATPDSVAASIGAATTSSTDGATGRKPLTATGWVMGVAGLLLLALILPILGNLMALPSGLLGLIIVYFGLMQAWRMNRRVEVELNGPFKVGAAGPASALPAA